MMYPESDQRPLITFDSVRRDFPDVYGDLSFDCGEGWSALLHVAGHFIREIRQTHRTSQDFPVRRVKEKLGELRIQIFNAPEPLYDYVEMARLLSLVTCETCGAVATSLDGGLGMRACAVHEAKHRPSLQDYTQPPPPPPLDFLATGPTGRRGLASTFWWAIQGIDDDHGKSAPLFHDRDDRLLCGVANSDPTAGRFSKCIREYGTLIDKKSRQ